MAFRRHHQRYAGWIDGIMLPMLYWFSAVITAALSVCHAQCHRDHHHGIKCPQHQTRKIIYDQPWILARSCAYLRVKSGSSAPRIGQHILITGVEISKERPIPSYVIIALVLSLHAKETAGPGPFFSTTSRFVENFATSCRILSSPVIHPRCQNK